MSPRRNGRTPTVVIGVNAFRQGGSQTYAIALGQLLHEHGIETVFVGKRGALSKRFRRLAPTVHVWWREGERDSGRSALKDALLRLAEMASRWKLRRRLRGPCVAIVSQPYPIAFFARYAASDPRMRAVVALVHGTSSVEWPPACDVRDLDAVFAANGSTAVHLSREIGTPVPELGNLFSADAYWGAFGVATPRAAHILFLGTLTAGKTEPLRALMRCLDPDDALLVCGDGPDRRELERLAADLAAQVSFLGSVEDPRGFIASARVVVTAGRGAIESLSAGRPVVVATSDGIHGAARFADLEELHFHNFTGRTPTSTPVATSHMREALDRARGITPPELDQLAVAHARVGELAPLLAVIEKYRAV